MRSNTLTELCLGSVEFRDAAAAEANAAVVRAARSQPTTPTEPRRRVTFADEALPTALVTTLSRPRREKAIASIAATTRLVAPKQRPAKRPTPAPDIFSPHSAPRPAKQPRTPGKTPLTPVTPAPSFETFGCSKCRWDAKGCRKCNPERFVHLCT